MAYAVAFVSLPPLRTVVYKQMPPFDVLCGLVLVTSMFMFAWHVTVMVVHK
jgi:hypothetical protein